MGVSEKIRECGERAKNHVDSILSMIDDMPFECMDELAGLLRHALNEIRGKVYRNGHKNGSSESV